MSIHSKVYGSTKFEPTTLVELLRWRADNYSNERAYTWLQHGDAEEIRLTYLDLDKKARAIGAWLQAMGVEGERALLIYPPGIDYIVAFYGCLYAGVTAVPAYPPDPTRLNRTLPRLQAIANDAQASIALTCDSILSMIKIMRLGSKVTGSLEKVPFLKKFGSSISSFISQRSAIANAKVLGDLKWLSTEKIKENRANDWKQPGIDKDTIAFLQYTSGSTGTPRGVMLSHENLLYNLALILNGFEMNQDFEGVIWLPIYHDMGLIGGVMQPLYAGFSATLMSPIDFLQRPPRWLKAISRIKDKPIVSGGPNFAYDLCTRKVSDDLRESLDLSNWAVAFSGAEPVRPATLNRFSETFKSCGFRREAFYPCYGLAEATLFASGGYQAEPPVILNIDKTELKNNRVVETTASEENSQTAVGCGHTHGEQQIAIVNPDRLTVCQPSEVGEIWVSGTSIAKGYWNRLEETKETFQAYTADTGEGPFLRTGDMGFLKDGELFVTGRMKDLIIIRGRNHYPQDIELNVENAYPGLRPGCNAVFSTDIDGQERLVVVQEVRNPKKLDADEVIKAIRQSVTETHELMVYSVVLIRPRTIPKTSSGKIQRRATKKEFLEGSLKVVKQWIAPAFTEQDEVLSDEEILQQEKVTKPTDADITLEKILEVESELRLNILITYLQDEVANVTHLNANQIDIYQPVTSFGIDSISVIELKHEIDSRLEVDYPVGNLLEGFSLEEIAKQLLEEVEAKAVESVKLVPSSEKVLKYALSYGQRALWFQHQVAPESIFNLLYAVRIRSKIDVPVLNQAFQALIDRHPALRTTFHTKNGEPFQKIHEGMAVSFKYEDASGWSEEELHNRIEQESRKQFDLENGPLFLVYLFSISEQNHVLLQTIHHIVADLWSQAIIANEIGILYASILNQKETDLAPIDIQYSDYVRWHSEMLESSMGEKLWQYWKEKLAGELPVLNFPTDRPRPSIQTFNGVSKSIELKPELTQKLKTISEQNGATIYMTLLAAFNVMLHRYTGQDDLVVGTPTTGRSRNELAPLVGYFVNPLPIRSDLSGNPKFTDILSQVRKTVVGAIDHQGYPLGLLVEKLQPRRDTSRTPLFQVMFVFQRAHLLNEKGLSSFAIGTEGAQMELGGLPLETYELEEWLSPFDFTLMMAESKQSLAASLTYNTDLFDEDTVDRMLGHFQILLESISENPEERIGNLALLPQVELVNLLEKFNDTDHEYPSDRCIQQLFEQNVERNPDAVAVVFEDKQLTYRELNQQANQLAHFLQKIGVGPDVIVGICVERSIDMIVAMWGVLKAGGAYLPLDPVYPEERLKLMVEDSSARFIITQKHLNLDITHDRITPVFLDTDCEEIANESQANPISAAIPENLAYVIYTSGSTGKPKGTLLQHRGLCNFATAHVRVLGVDSSSRWLQFASFSFDASVSEIFTAFIAGGSLYLATRETILATPKLIELLEKHQINTAILPPSMLAILPAEKLPGLQTVISAGESLPLDVVAKWAENRKFYNGYGPTETTVGPTIYQVEKLPDGAISIPIGRPLDNIKAYILDKNFQPVPIGASGELYLGGVCLARGYHDRPGLTAQKFIPNPFGSEPGQRLYRTGDLACFRNDGNIEFLGRVDFQVKIRGFRIELEEVESGLKKHPAVESAVVVAKKDKSDENQLVAYIVHDHQPVPETDELRNFLKSNLPDYMVPSFFVPIEQLPLTRSGKIDRKALPEPQELQLVSEATFVKPRTETETLLATIWQDVLKLEKVGIHDSFFDLGGHSLSMAKVHSKLCEHTQRDISIIELFKYPTIHSLSHFLQQDQDKKPMFEEKQQRASRQREALEAQRQRMKGRKVIG